MSAKLPPAKRTGKEPKTETAAAKTGGTIRELMENNKASIARALPKGIEPHRFWQIAWTAIRINPRLQSADPQSLLGAVMEAAQAGLSLDRSARQASLVPFWNSKKGRTEVQFIPQYGGYIALAHRSNKVSTVDAKVVYENEPFTIMEGARTQIHHVPLPPSERGINKKGCYARVRMKDGTDQIDWMWTEEIIAVRDRSFRGKGIDPKSPSEKWGAWLTDEDEMFKKTVIRRLAKVIPLSSEWTKVATRDEYRDAGVLHPSDLELEAAHDASLAEFGPPVEKETTPLPSKSQDTQAGTTEGGEPFPKDEGTHQPGGDDDAVPMPKHAARALLHSKKIKPEDSQLGTASPEQIENVERILRALGYDDPEYRCLALSTLLSVEIQKINDLSLAEASAVLDVLNEINKGTKRSKN